VWFARAKATMLLLPPAAPSHKSLPAFDESIPAACFIVVGVLKRSFSDRVSVLKLSELATPGSRPPSYVMSRGHLHTPSRICQTLVCAPPGLLSCCTPLPSADANWSGESDWFYDPWWGQSICRATLHAY
jgi:hypothetical protein